ncbi:MAG: ribosomal-protein-alanine N-acetyltransferase [Planctomycetota bacterium]|jgi:ribosomal-protein-alanine N-acetyltransferase
MLSQERREKIEKSRVYLRTPRLVDREEYFNLLRVSEAFHAPWSPALPAGFDPYSNQAFADFIERMGPAHRRERRLVCRKSDDRILANVNMSEIVRGCFQSTYLGYWVGAPFSNQGYMKEGMLQIIELCFGELGLHRLEANIRPENEPSLRLVQGAGFKLEGYSPRYLKIDGAWRDHERWTILADD